MSLVGYFNAGQSPTQSGTGTEWWQDLLKTGESLYSGYLENKAQKREQDLQYTLAQQGYMAQTGGYSFANQGAMTGFPWWLIAVAGVVVYLIARK
jgi:hypothetical protein